MPLPLPSDPLPPPVLLPPPPSTSGENPVWSGWDVLLIAGFTLLMFVITQLIIAPGLLQFAYPHTRWLDVAQKPVSALLAQLLTYIVVALYMILLIEGKYHTRFWQSIRWNWPQSGAATFVGLGVLMLGLDFLGRLLPMPKNTPFDQFFARPSDAYLTAVFAVTLGPLWEELLFRGFLYPVLARRLGVVWGIVLTAVPFGLMHYLQYRSWGAVLIIFLVGVILTTVRAMTKSVASSFLAHAGYNATLMVLAAVATDGFRHMDKASCLLF
ncbi:MAG TPA: type II CAAX endopeptidase family protein [Candidatus Eremiobacteraceae bacterium]|nr:type II CAAX endopeptidase family protein [Candidatus Eremiobacteraceae bacterium]